jgi:hypothetical protein
MRVGYNFETLRPLQDRIVRIVSTTGEIMRAKIRLVSQSERDILVTILDTNRPQELGPQHSADKWYAIPFDFLASVEPEPAPRHESL